MCRCRRGWLSFIVIIIIIIIFFFFFFFFFCEAVGGGLNSTSLLAGSDESKWQREKAMTSEMAERTPRKGAR